MAETTSLIIEVNTTSVKDAQQELGKLADNSKQAETATDSLSDASKGLLDAQAAMARELESINRELAQHKNEIALTKGLIDQYQSEIKKLTAQTQDYEKTLAATAKSEADAIKARDEAVKSTQEAVKAFNDQAEAYHKQQQSQEKANEAAKQHAEAVKKSREEMSALLAQLNPTEKKLQELDETERKLTEAWKLGAIEAGTYKTALGEVNRQRDDAVKGSSSMIESLGGIAAALGAAALAAKGFSLISTVTEQAARYEQLGVLMYTLGNNAGYAAAYLDDLQSNLRASGISMSQSRDVVMSMVSANMDLTQALDLARLAQDAATIAGISSSDALEKMIQGIQTGQTQVLRGIGINVNFEQSYATMAATLGKTTAQLTEVEKQQARANIVLAQASGIANSYGNSMETAAKQAGSMERLVSDLQTSMGRMFQSGYSQAIKAQSTALGEAAKHADILALAVSGAVAGLSVLTVGLAAATKGAALFGAALNLVTKHPIILAVSALTSVLAAGYLAWSDSTREVGAYKGSLDILDGSVADVTASIRELNRVQQESLALTLSKKIEEEAEKIKAARDEIESAFLSNVAAGAGAYTFGGESMINDAQAQIQDLIDLFAKGEVSSNDFVATLQDAMSRGDIPKELYSEIITLASGLDEASTESERLKNQQQVLQQAMLNTGQAGSIAAAGVGELDKALKDAQAAGARYAESLKLRALTAGATTETEKTKILEEAGVYAFASDEIKNAAYESAAAIDAANESRKRAVSVGKNLNAELKAEEQAWKALVKAAMPYEAATQDLAKNTETLDKALKAGKVTQDEYNATLTNLTKTYNDAVIATIPHVKAIEDQIKSTEGAVKSMRERIDAHGKTASAIASNALAETNARIVTLESIKSVQMATGASAEYLEQLELEIDALKRLQVQQEHQVGLTYQAAALDEYKKAADEAIRMNEEIGKTLTDALMRGFESGKSFAKNMYDTIDNMSKTMVLRPIIEPVMQSVAGALTGGVAGESSGGIGGLLGGAKSISDIGSILSGGLVNGLANGIGKVGSMLGSTALTSFASGMSGTAMASAMSSLAGTAVQTTVAGLGGSLTIGSGAAASLGTSAATGGAIGGMSGAGAMLGAAAPYLAAGLAAYQLISSFTNKGETRHGGGFVYDPMRGSTSFAGGPSGGYGGQQTLGAVNDLFQAAANTIIGVFETTGSDAVLSMFHGAFESSEKGRGGTFSGGDIVLSDGTVIGFGTQKKGQGFGGTSGSADEMFGNLQQDVYFSVLEAWQAAGAELPKTLHDMVASMDVRAMTAEQAKEAVEGISAFSAGIRALINELDVMPIKNLTGLSFDLAASLVQSAGGIDQLTAGINSFYGNFVPETERAQYATRQMSQQLQEVGIIMPETRDGFRQLVESLDLTTAAGQDAFTAMLSLSDAASEFYHVFESVAQSISATIGNLYERITLDIMETDEQRYNYYSKQFDALSTQLDFASDAQEINRIVEEMTRVAGTAYGLLDEEARKEGGKGREFLSMLDELQEVANERLEHAREVALNDQQERDTSFVNALTEQINVAGDNLAVSADKIGAWAGGVESRVEALSSQVSALARAVSSMSRGSEVN